MYTLYSKSTSSRYRLPMHRTEHFEIQWDNQRSQHDYIADKEVFIRDSFTSQHLELLGNPPYLFSSIFFHDLSNASRNLFLTHKPFCICLHSDSDLPHIFYKLSICRLICPLRYSHQWNP